MLNKTPPPKGREFLGLVKCDYTGTPYWDFFLYGTKAHGVKGRPCFVDRGLEDMPELIGWIEIPPMEE